MLTHVILGMRVKVGSVRKLRTSDTVAKTRNFRCRRDRSSSSLISPAGSPLKLVLQGLGAFLTVATIFDHRTFFLECLLFRPGFLITFLKNYQFQNRPENFANERLNGSQIRVPVQKTMVFFGFSRKNM